jgi:hypothetical protein
MYTRPLRSCTGRAPSSLARSRYRARLSGPDQMDTPGTRTQGRDNPYHTDSLSVSSHPRAESTLYLLSSPIVSAANTGPDSHNYSDTQCADTQRHHNQENTYKTPSHDRKYPYSSTLSPDEGRSLPPHGPPTRCPWRTCAKSSPHPSTPAHRVYLCSTYSCYSSHKFRGRSSDFHTYHQPYDVCDDHRLSDPRTPGCMWGHSRAQMTAESRAGRSVELSAAWTVAKTAVL